MIVNHSIGEYVRGDVHTNTIEGYFSILKRGIIGTYHHVSEQHLKRYLAEFDFRYNERSALGVEDDARSDRLIRGIVGSGCCTRTRQRRRPETQTVRTTVPMAKKTKKTTKTKTRKPRATEFYFRITPSARRRYQWYALRNTWPVSLPFLARPRPCISSSCKLAARFLYIASSLRPCPRFVSGTCRPTR